VLLAQRRASWVMAPGGSVISSAGRRKSPSRAWPGRLGWYAQVPLEKGLPGASFPG
jgi:hypothetical protein